MRLTLSLAILFVFLGCSAAQLEKTKEGFQAVQNSTTQPVVVATAEAISPVTGGISTLALSAVGTLAGLGVILIQTLQNNKNKVRLIDAVVKGAEAATGVLNAPITLTVQPSPFPTNLNVQKQGPVL